MVNFKVNRSLKSMAKITGFLEIMYFCKLISELDIFETPNYEKLRRVLNIKFLDSSIISNKPEAQIIVPLFPNKKYLKNKKLL